MSEPTTKDTILDAAEQLFAVNGFAGTSLRSIIKRAGVNTASIHYHFGSREGLIEAAIARRAGPANEERLAMLDRLEAAHPAGALPVEGVVHAFLDPVARMIQRRRPRERVFLRMVGHAIMESGQELSPVFASVFRRVIERFVPAFQRALPGLSPEDVMWRIHFLLGAMVFTITVPPHPQLSGSMSAGDVEPDAAFERLTAFVAAGMAAESSETRGNPTA